MPGNQTRRKIVAILASDVVGYSRLAGVDEDRTLARLRALRSDLIDPTIAVHHGRVVKRTGDGALVEFSSVVDAVRCAIEVQNGMIERNAGLPAERRIEFRIGIHLGDVVEESDGDLMGDGVNIAARLEGIAKPGAICLSEDAYRQVKARLDLVVGDLGEQHLKNIAEPIRVYSLEVGRPAQPKPAAALAPPPLSIVVLPFVNLSGDPEQQYLADVLTENLTTGLARIHGVFVIARSTAFTYKGKPVDVKQVGKDLGVHYALEGSEQHSRDKLRVSAQLIDVATGAHLWADQFVAPRSDLFEAEDAIVRRIARTLEIKLINADLARAARSRPNDPDAQDLALRCRAAHYNVQGNLADPRNLVAACERSLRADEHDVFALSVLAAILAISVFSAQSIDPQADLEKADELISRALALDADSDTAHNAKSCVLLGRNLHEQAISEAERALALNPSYIEAYSNLCAANNFLGRPNSALELADEAIRLSPRDPFLPAFYHHKGWAFFMKQQYEPAVEWLRRAGYGIPFTNLLLASALALTSRSTEAKKVLDQYKAYPGVNTTTITQLRMQQFALADNSEWIAYNERLFDGLRKAGMPEN
jgi:adenylate cyclase